MNAEKLSLKAHYDCGLEDLSSEDSGNLRSVDQSVRTVPPSEEEPSLPEPLSSHTSDFIPDTARITTTKWEVWAYYTYYIGNSYAIPYLEPNWQGPWTGELCSNGVSEFVEPSRI